MSSVALGGGEDGENPEIIKACSEGTSASACFLLAEDSQCGVGFNSETAKFIEQAKQIYKTRCKAGFQNDCLGKTLWEISSVFLEEDDEDIYYSWAYLGGILSNPQYLGHWDDSNLTKQELLKEAIKQSELGCSKDHAKSCLLTAEILTYQSLKSKTSSSEETLKYWKKACELNHPEGCARLSLILSEQAKSLSQKACTMGSEEQYSYRFTTKYKDLCESSQSK